MNGKLFPLCKKCTEVFSLYQSLLQQGIVHVDRTQSPQYTWIERVMVVMALQQLTLQEVNALDQGGFVATLSSLFEGPPWIVRQTWSARPFTSLTHLHQALCKVMYDAPIEQQITLIQAHPDLVGRAAQAGTLSSASTGEQAAAGLNQLTSEEIATFNRYNQAYRERFGFPFVICARENKKESILAGFTTRINNTREQEIHTALGEVAKICWLRLLDTISDDE